MKPHSKESLESDLSSEPETDSDSDSYDSKEKVKGMSENVRSFLKEQGVDVLSRIGRGFFAEVYKAKVGNQILAVKSLALIDPNKERERFEVGNQIKVAETIHHKNIIKNHMVIRMEGEFVFFVQDLAEGGDLLAIIEEEEPIEERLVKKWFSETVDGIDYMHSKGWAHRDIKVDNILLQKDDPNSDEWTAKVTDFGFSQYCWNDQKQVVFVTNSAATVEFSSPENLIWRVDKGIPFDPFVSDSYSLGICLYCMVTQCHPFHLKKTPKKKPEVKKYHKRMLQNKWRKTKKIKENELLFDLLSRLLESDIETRLKTPDIKSHQWFSSPQK